MNKRQSEGDRWSVRKSRVRGIERKIERKKSRERKVSLNIPSYTVEWRGTERVEEPWNLGAGVSEAQVQASLMTLL